MPISGSIEVWVADLSRVPDRLGQLLSDAERKRASRLRDTSASRRWVASRAVLRDLLGRVVGTDPASLRFDLGAHGKPYLQCLQSGAPMFNMSHSGGLAVYALSRGPEVGVDIEMLDRGQRQGKELAIAQRMLGVEVAERLRCLPEDRLGEEFLKAWVAHEALVKCLGHGLDERSMQAARAEASARGAPADVWVSPLEVGEEAVAALAVMGGGLAVEVRAWEPLRSP